MQQLERAITVYEQWVTTGRPVTAAQLVEQNADLREFLEAMLADGGELDAAIAAADGEGRELGDFRLLEEIGRGGMGVVYRARQRSLDREVALKVLPNHVTLAPSAVARFRREATLAARLEHPNIVAIHAVGTVGDTHFFAMELIDGAHLRRIDPVTGNTRTIRQCAELCATICDALAHAHAAGVLHRDIKPSNILVRRDGRPVLTDFGLARELDDPGITNVGAFAGTPHYASPEQVAGSKAIDARVDVFGLGATLYELLTGQRPFEGRSTAEVLDRITHTEPTDPLRIVPDLAPDLVAIVQKALEKEPTRRYQSAREFGEDLRAFLEFRPILARRPTPLLRLRRWIHREPLRATLAAVLVVGVPAISVAAGYLIANRTAIQVGARELRRQGREERLARVTIDLEAGDYEAALANAALAIKERPDDIEAHVLRAMTRVYSGRRDQALPELEAAVAARGLPFGNRARVYVLTALDRIDEARAIAATLGEARAPEEFFLDGCTTTMRGQSNLMDTAVWRTVRDTFQRAMLVSPSPRLHYYLKWATAIGWIGDPTAIQHCNAVLMELWPDSPAALLYVAFSLRQREPARGAELYRRVLAAGYDHPRIHTSIADCLANAGDADGARAALLAGLAAYQARERAGRLGDPDVLNMAIRMHDVGQVEAAVKKARAVVARNPGMGRGHRVLGWLLVESRDLDGAIAEFEAAVGLDPNDAEAFQRLAEARLANGDPTGAITAIRRLTELMPSSPYSHTRLAEVMLAAPEVDAAEALAAAREADDRAQGKSLRARIALARALAAGGERTEAIALLEAAEQDPAFATSPERSSLSTTLAVLRQAR